MIWQVLKRENGWRWAPLPASIFALVGPGHEALLFFVLINLVAIMPDFRVRCTFHQAALPIQGRDLWAARTLSLLAFIWLPASAAALVSLPLRSSASLWLEVAAILTVFLLGLGRVRIREFSVPQRFRLTVLFIAVPVALTPIYFESARRSDLLPPAAVILATCGVAGAALLAWTWTAVPKTFQSAPVRPRRSFRRGESERSWLLWSPVVRSIPRPLLSFAFFGSLLAFTGAAPVGCCMAGFALLGAANTRRFIAPLPVRASILFRIVAIPMLAMIATGEAFRFFFDKDSLGVRLCLTELAIAAAALLVMLVSTELGEWRRLSRLPQWMRAMPLTLCAFGPIGIEFAKGAGAFEHGARALEAVLPAELPALILTLLVPIVLLYWLAETMFGQMELSMLTARREPAV